MTCRRRYFAKKNYSDVRSFKIHILLFYFLPKILLQQKYGIILLLLFTYSILLIIDCQHDYFVQMILFETST